MRRLCDVTEVVWSSIRPSVPPNVPWHVSAEQASKYSSISELLLYSIHYGSAKGPTADGRLEFKFSGLSSSFLLLVSFQ